MIESDLLDMGVGLGVADSVAAAVADVDHPCVPLFHQQRDESSPHAIEIRVALRAGKDSLIRGGDGLLGFGREGICLRAVGERPHHLADGEATGHFASGGAAHSVADDVHSVLHGIAERILVGRALATAVGKRRGRVVGDSRSQEKTPVAQCIEKGRPGTWRYGDIEHMRHEKVDRGQTGPLAGAREPKASVKAYRWAARQGPQRPRATAPAGEGRRPVLRRR